MPLSAISKPAPGQAGAARPGPPKIVHRNLRPHRPHWSHYCKFNGLARTVSRQFAVATSALSSDRPPRAAKPLSGLDFGRARTLRPVRTVEPPHDRSGVSRPPPRVRGQTIPSSSTFPKA
jgi:hypothetical protein